MTPSHAVADPYRELGVAPGATRDEIAAAYRSRAKALHPDARPDDPDAAEQFKRVGAAYRLLSDPAARARHDGSFAVLPVPGAHAAATLPRPTTGIPHRGRLRLSRRGARWAVAGGAVLLVVGVVAGGFVFSLQRRDAQLRASGVAAEATVVESGGNRMLEFTAGNGRVVRAVEPVKSGEEQPPVGTRIPIHYDRHDPTSITTDAGHLARDITLWVVSVKFLVGGAALLWFGTRRLRRREAV